MSNYEMRTPKEDGTKSHDNYNSIDLIWLLPIGALIIMLVMVVPELIKSSSNAGMSYSCISSDKALCDEYRTLKNEQAELLQKLAIERLKKENKEYSEILRSLSK